MSLYNSIVPLAIAIAGLPGSVVVLAVVSIALPLAVVALSLLRPGAAPVDDSSEAGRR